MLDCFELRKTSETIYGKFFTWSLETTYGAGQRNSISIFQMEKLRLKDKWLP